ncbi:hypothetical protein POSPLADRAFT_1042393 [Postia placenta MAD-698-R-SB12]|uniref:Uncharacterized protein n=1 Tax=Postia placenta MAD-698-R-SB12 TaxID=670580 RepID=A0A1X6NFC8_9APHY|nr:hypothetical protein POSPLADRAFT_1042393 [Postia placenta MAD-698-R-SB12]OSX67126.1 hypothetical protein POSPLADRAFT_1042393 [Postia placenta MAD-698-R-SB12]
MPVRSGQQTCYLTSFVTGTGRHRRRDGPLSGAGEWWRAQSRFTAICYATPPASSTRETSLRARAAIASSAQGPDQRYYDVYIRRRTGAGSPGARGARTLRYVRLLLLSAAMLMGQSSPANVMATIFGTKQDRCAHGTGAHGPSGRSCPVYRDCQRKEACGPELSSTSSRDRTLRNERPELRELGTKDGGWRTRSEDAAKDPAHMNAFELTLPQGCPRDDGCRWWAIEVGGLLAVLGYQMSSDDDQCGGLKRVIFE